MYFMGRTDVHFVYRQIISIPVAFKASCEILSSISTRLSPPEAKTEAKIGIKNPRMQMILISCKKFVIKILENFRKFFEIFFKFSKSGIFKSPEMTQHGHHMKGDKILKILSEK